jgi:hypothetical protein
MAMTVKKLIRELENIENKFLEVEVYSIYSSTVHSSIQRIRKVDKKVLIFTDDNKLI